MSFTKEQAETWLNIAWRCLRDGCKGQYIDRIHGALWMLESLAVLSPVEVDGWKVRLSRCPGHDDEGGRSWCAYCGNMKPEEATS